MTRPAQSRSALCGGIVLPTLPNQGVRRQIDRAALDEALDAGRFLGFVSRDPLDHMPISERRRPGPRRREAQDRLSIPGPRRVTSAVRHYCSMHGLTHWEGLERLMERSEEGGNVAAADAAIGSGPASSDVVSALARNDRNISAIPNGQVQGRDMITTTVAMPAEMQAWVAAWGAGARYGDAGDYVRDVIRRDQESRAYV